MAGVIDHEARAKASEALQAVYSHEKHCSERWSEARASMRDAHDAIQAASRVANAAAGKLHTRINGLVLIVALGTIGTLTNVILLLLTKG